MGAGSGDAELGELAQLLGCERRAVHERARLRGGSDEALHLVNEDAGLRLGIHPQDCGGVELDEPRRRQQRRQGLLAPSHGGAELGDEELQVPLRDVCVGDRGALRRDVDHVSRHAEESGGLSVADLLLLKEAHIGRRRAAGRQRPVLAGDEHVAALDGHLVARLHGIRLERRQHLVLVLEVPVRDHPVIAEPVRRELRSRRPQPERPGGVRDGGEADGEAGHDVLPFVPDLGAGVQLPLDPVADDAAVDEHGHVAVRDEVDAAGAAGAVSLADDAVAVACPVEVVLRGVHPLFDAHVVARGGDEHRRLRHLDLQAGDLAERVDRERRHEARAQILRRPDGRLSKGRLCGDRLSLEAGRAGWMSCPDAARVLLRNRKLTGHPRAYRCGSPQRRCRDRRR